MYIARAQRHGLGPAPKGRIGNVQLAPEHEQPRVFLGFAEAKVQQMVFDDVQLLIELREHDSGTGPVEAIRHERFAVMANEGAIELVLRWQELRWIDAPANQ